MKEQASVKDVLDLLFDLDIHAFEMFTAGFVDEVEKDTEGNLVRRDSRACTYVFGFNHGVCLVICVKKFDDKISDQERRFIRRHQDLGNVAFVARTLEQVAEEISKHWPESLLEFH